MVFPVIVLLDPVGIEEHSGGQLEADAMLVLIRLVFLFIP